MQSTPIEKRGHIYKMTCTITKKCYIGQTRAYRKKGKTHKKFGYLGRCTEHFREANNLSSLGKCKKLNRAIRSHGKESFTCELIYECHPNFLNHYEKLFIDEFNSCKDGYNILRGGTSMNRSSEITDAQRGIALGKVHDLKRKNFINKNAYDFKKIMLYNTMSEGVNMVKCDIRNENSIIKIYSFGGGTLSIEDGFKRAYSLFGDFDPLLIYVDHKLQFMLGDFLDEYEFNRDDVEQLAKGTEDIRDTNEKRLSKFEGLTITEVNVCHRFKNDTINIAVCVRVAEQKRIIESQFSKSNSDFKKLYDAALEFANMLIEPDQVHINTEILNIINRINKINEIDNEEN